MKKKIVISVFLLLILITSIIFIVGAIQSYNYDMDPANGVDVLEGFGAAITLGIGGFVVFYELDLFYTVYYFLIKPKTKIKSLFNILSNISLFLFPFSEYIAHFLFKYVSEIFGEEVIVLFAFLVLYIVSRIICAVVPVGQSNENAELNIDNEE